MPEGRQKPFLAPKPQAELEAAPEVHPLLLKFATWNDEDWELDAPSEKFPLREIAPDATDFLVEAGFFSPRDIKALVQHFRMDIDPKDAHAFYDRILDVAETEAWVFPMIEIDTAAMRAGKKKAKRPSYQQESFERIIRKLPLNKLRLKHNPLLQERLSELLVPPPVSADLAVAVFFEYAFEEFRRRQDAGETGMDTLYELHMGRQSPADITREFFDFCAADGSWGECGRFLVSTLGPKTEFSPEDMGYLVRVLRELGASVDPSWAPQRFRLVEDLAEIAARAAENLTGRELEVTLETMRDLGLEVSEDDLDDEILETLRQPWVWMIVSHGEHLSAQVEELAQQSDAVHAEIAEATASRSYDQLAELAPRAKQATEASEVAQSEFEALIAVLADILAGDIVDRDGVPDDLRAAAGVDDDIDGAAPEAGATWEDDDSLGTFGEETAEDAGAAVEEVETLVKEEIGAAEEERAPAEPAAPVETKAGEAPDAPGPKHQEVPAKAMPSPVPEIEEVPGSGPPPGMERAPEGIGDPPVEEDRAEDTAPAREPAVPAPVLADLVERDLLGIAADTARAIERAGASWPIEARVLHVAAASRTPHRDYGADSQSFVDMAQQARSVVHGDVGSVMLFGATLVPTITQHDMTARQRLPELCRGRLGKHLQEVADAVSSLTYDFPPEPDVLAGLSGGQRVPRKTRLAARLAQWCEITRGKQSRWGFATLFMHHVASENGPVGAACAAIVEDRKTAPGLVEAALEAIGDASAIEASSVEFAASVGRSARLHRKGIEYLDRHFDAARALLEAWLSAAKREGKAGKGAEERLPAIVQNLESRLEKARKSLREVAAAGGERLEAALAGWVAARIDDAMAALKGDDAGRFTTIAEALDAERDLLTAQARQEIEATGVTPVHLKALLEAGVPAPEEAFERACQEGAFETAARLMERYGLDRAEWLRECMTRFVSEWREAVENRERRLKTLAKLDYTSQDDIARWLSWCDTTLKRFKEIAEGAEVDDLDGIPGQVAETDALAELIEARIRKDQAERIPKYRNNQNAEEADDLLENLEAHAIEAIEDRIAQLRDGRSVASFEVDLEGLVGNFTPGFVTAAAGPDWPQSSKAYEAAIAGDGLLATEEDRRAAALSLIDLYRDIGRSVKGGSPASDKIRQFFEDIGFEGVRVSDLRQIGRSKAWRMKLSGRISSDGWFLPPTFGSKATGGYAVFLLGPDTLPEAIQKALDAETPTILLVAGCADLARRHEFAERMRANAIPGLLIDEALVAFAATRRETRARTIFECGLPYGRVEPYTTDAGRLPPEMFFGREAEIRAIMSKRADGCLVYGGRQLGKSALLAHVARTRHAPEEGRIVKVLERKSLGDAEDISAIWAHLNTMLSEHGVVREASRSAETVTKDIRAWLDENPGSQIVCMFDEADNFMTADTKAGYPVLSELKSLMEGTGRAFKVVFAGLHNVKRMYRQPNSPLAHLGDPICIGPLNKNADDKRSAHDLVVDPMRAAGFRFETQEAVEEILAWANYYPSLVQEYAKGLLATQHGAGSGKPYKLSKDGPLWVVPTDELFSHRGFSQIEARVREKFQLTLNLDPRYALVAYTLAFLNAEGEEHKARIAGFDAAELLEHVKGFWPKTTEQPTQAAFEVLLDELFDLGVLGRVTAPGTSRPAYVLRSRQVAAMLGSWEEIVHALQQLEEVDPTLYYDRALYRRRYAPDERAESASQQSWPYSPLTDHQIERLLQPDETRSPVRIVCGLDILGLGKVRQAIKRLAEMGQLAGAQTENVEVVTVDNPRDLRRALERVPRPGGPMKIILRRPGSAGEAEEEIAWLERRPEVIGSENVLRPIFILDAADPEMRGIATRRQDAAELLRPWSEEMIRFHLHNIEHTELDSRALRQRILEATGGIPSEAISLVKALYTSDDHETAFSEWRTSVRFPEGLSTGDLGRALGVIEDTEDAETYDVINDLLREETGKDIITLGPDLVATGLVAVLSARSHRIRVSALGRMVREAG